jgi:predicted AAA+ superfamily ATPase
MPAVVVTGARQTGKTALVQQLTPGGRRYFTLDDLDTLDAARREPEVLTGGSGPVTLDEVQREPELLKAVKARRRCRAGRGSPRERRTPRPPRLA